MVKEQQGLRFDIFRSYTSANDTAGAIKALKKYGPEEPQLYPAALAYFTSSPKILEEAGGELETVLKRIDVDGLMAPLQVIQTLSTNAVATMGMVKKYLSDIIEKERKEISNVICSHLEAGNNPLIESRTAVLLKATAARQRLNAKKSMISKTNLLYSRQDGAPHVEEVSIYLRSTSYANTPSIKIVSTRSMVRKPSVHNVRPPTITFVLSEEPRKILQTGMICFKMRCNGAGINLARLASFMAEVL